MRYLTPLLAGAALASIVIPASAQSFFWGDGYAGASVTPGDPSSSGYDSSYGNGGADVLPGSTSGSASFTANGVSAVGSASGSYAAASGFDGLTVSAASSHSYPATSPNSSFGNFLGYGAGGSGRGFAYLTVTDLVFSGPSSALPVTLNGMFQASGSANGNASFGAWVGASLSGTQIPGSGEYSGAWTGDPSGAFGGNLLDAYTSGTMSFQTGIWIVPVNTPVSLNLQLEVSAGGSGGYDTTSDASGSASLFLPTSGPVFNLPDGFTVNSASLGIVNNAYSPVPEPEEYAAMAGLGLVGFGLWRRAARRA